MRCTGLVRFGASGVFERAARYAALFNLVSHVACLFGDRAARDAWRGRALVVLGLRAARPLGVLAMKVNPSLSAVWLNGLSVKPWC
jgi:hypothetical protein